MIERKEERLLSLDTLRGFDMLFIMRFSYSKQVSGYMGQTSATDGVCGDFVVKI